jgi:hypothetical protein
MAMGPAASHGTGRCGRKMSYFTEVQVNGNLITAAAYTAQLGVKAGELFQIRLGKRQIKTGATG